MIIVVNYGLGNLASVANMVRKAGGDVKISNLPNELLSASKLILPGVGSFDHGITCLQSLGLFDAIQKAASKGILILGICLGMQLLAKRSEEGTLNGLGLIDAEFKRFRFNRSSSLRVPHVGWNFVHVVKENPLIPSNDCNQRFYFTHSYHAICNNEANIMATTNYGYPFTSVYGRDHIFGVQFHPEKSHRFGFALIKRYVELQNA
jgi:imidazole glycerol-phosphate synthase subunit HisH